MPSTGTPNDDVSIPPETAICYSRRMLALYAVMAIALIGYGIYSVLVPKAYVIGSLLIVVPAVMLVFGWKYIDVSKPQLIISNQGIKTGDMPLVPWSKIRSEEVKWVDRGKVTAWHLLYQHPGGKIDIDLTNLAVKHQQMAHLLEVYRARSDRFYGKTGRSK